MIKNQSIPAMIAVSLVTGVMWYVRGTYTQITPLHWSAEESYGHAEAIVTEDTLHDYLLRPVTLNHVNDYAWYGEQEHWSAPVADRFLVTVKDDEWWNKIITPMNYTDLHYSVTINSIHVWDYTGDTITIPTDYISDQMKIVVVIVNENWDAVLDENWDLLVANAYIS